MSSALTALLLPLGATLAVWLLLRLATYYLSRPPQARLRQLLRQPAVAAADSPSPPATTMVVLGSGAQRQWVVHGVGEVRLEARRGSPLT